MSKVGRRALSHIAAVAIVVVAAAWTVVAVRAENDSIVMDEAIVELRTAQDRTDNAPQADAPSVVPESPAVEQATAPAPQEELGRIHIEYVPPKKAAHQKTYEAVKNRRVLERVQEIFSPFRLPEEIYIKTLECDGKPNTYFDREEDRPTVKLCYEYLKSIHDKMPKKPTSSGITPREVMVGQFLFAAAHELGHALLDVYNIPVFGRQEDAADEFATYFILQFGGDRARRLILGAAYSYRGFVKPLTGNPKVTLPLTAFSSDHGQPEQRFYNLVCIAYGYDPKLFASAVEKKYLPATRAKVCELEYKNLRYAVKTHINPHIDEALAQKVIDKGFSPALDPPAPEKGEPAAAKGEPAPTKVEPAPAKGESPAAKSAPQAAKGRARSAK
jgi:Putative metallopeptidase